MSDQENIKPDEENDVEAHKRSAKLANEEAKDDSKEDDDVELHSRGRKLL